MDQQTLTVTELNHYIKGLLDQDPMLGNVSVRGELSNYKVYPSGHHYFTLKDSESSLRCVMFKSSASKLRFRPESGMGVTAYGRIAVYPRDGAYQLYCTGLMPEGAGDLQVAFEQLKAQLAAEGLFDRAHKKPLPQFPSRIAIITSSAGAAVHDMIRILSHRWPMAQVDVIITGRGGGSIEDLWAFNDERVARAIYASELPVISAVGHEPDVTISDYVADARASTPSNAAEIVVPDQRDIRDALDSFSIRQDQALRKKLMHLSQQLEAYQSKRVITDPVAHIDNRRISLDHARDRLVAAEERNLSACRQRFVGLAASLDAMSPLRVLGRGYAIAEDGLGQAIKSVKSLSPGDTITVELCDGRADCLVQSVTEKPE